MRNRDHDRTQVRNDDGGNTIGQRQPHRCWVGRPSKLSPSGGESARAPVRRGFLSCLHRGIERGPTHVLPRDVSRRRSANSPPPSIALAPAYRPRAPHVMKPVFAVRAFPKTWAFALIQTGGYNTGRRLPRRVVTWSVELRELFPGCRRRSPRPTGAAVMRVHRVRKREVKRRRRSNQNPG
jgi:hypothetical protein